MRKTLTVLILLMCLTGCQSTGDILNEEGKARILFAGKACEGQINVPLEYADIFDPEVALARRLVLRDRWVQEARANNAAPGYIQTILTYTGLALNAMFVPSSSGEP